MWIKFLRWLQSRKHNIWCWKCKVVQKIVKILRELRRFNVTCFVFLSLFWIHWPIARTLLNAFWLSISSLRGVVQEPGKEFLVSIMEVLFCKRSECLLCSDIVSVYSFGRVMNRACDSIPVEEKEISIFFLSATHIENCSVLLAS